MKKNTALEGALRDTARRAAVPRLEQYAPAARRYPVKALTGAILAGLAALALAIVFLAGSGGFTVTFETLTAVPRCPRRPAATASWSGVPRTP